jgi:hypothetical protein
LPLFLHKQFVKYSILWAKLLASLPWLKLVGPAHLGAVYLGGPDTEFIELRLENLMLVDFTDLLPGAKLTADLVFDPRCFCGDVLFARLERREGRS